MGGVRQERQRRDDRLQHDRAGARGETEDLIGSTAYHGSQPGEPHLPGTPPEEHVHYPTYVFNDAENLVAVAEAASGDLAGIVVSGYKHDVPHTQELVDPAFARVRGEICDAEGAALILDDVRSGLRLSLDASWSEFGIQPDLSAWGRHRQRRAARRRARQRQVPRGGGEGLLHRLVLVPGGALRRGIETLDVLNEADAPRHMERLGQQLRDGLYEQASDTATASTRAARRRWPLVQFEDDPKRARASRVLHHALRNGVYLHPCTTCSCPSRTPRRTSPKRSRAPKRPSPNSPEAAGGTAMDSPAAMAGHPRGPGTPA